MAGENTRQKTEVEILRDEIAELRREVQVRNDTEIEPEAAALAGAIHALADAITLHARMGATDVNEQDQEHQPGTLDAT